MDTTSSTNKVCVAHLSKVWMLAWPCFKGTFKSLKMISHEAPKTRLSNLEKNIFKRWESLWLKYLPQHFGEMPLTGLNAGAGGMFSAPSSDPLILVLIMGGKRASWKGRNPLGRRIDLFWKLLFLISGRHCLSQPANMHLLKHHLCGLYAEQSPFYLSLSEDRNAIK